MQVQPRVEYMDVVESSIIRRQRISEILSWISLILIPFGVFLVFAGVGTMEHNGDNALGILLSIIGLLFMFLGSYIYKQVELD